MSTQDLGQYVAAVRQNGVRLNANEPLVTNGALVSAFEYIESPILTSASATQPLYTMPNDGTTWKVIACSARFSTAGGSGATVTIESAGAAVAPGSGTAQLTAALVLTGTANTTVNGTVIASPTTLAAGQSLNLVLAGTLTGLAGCAVTIVLQRLS